jgi:hypothetical protein
MAVTQIWRASRIRAAGGRAAAGGGCGRSHRAGHRLWVLLNAPALLDGTAGTPGVVLVEDDRRRMAARRAS